MGDSEYAAKLRKCDRAFSRIVSIAGTNPQSASTLNKAYRLIVQRFGNQVRKSGDLAITHHLCVAQKLAEMGFGYEVVTGGLLHDLVEDTYYGLTSEQAHLPYNERVPIQIAALAADFSEKIARFVDIVTAIETIDAEQDSPHKDFETYKKLWDSDAQHREAFYIKFADRWHNLSDREAMPEIKMTAKADDTERYLLKLAEYIGAHTFYNELGDLVFEIKNPAEYRAICNRLNWQLARGASAIASTEQILRLTFRDDTSHLNPQLSEIRSRVKSVISEQVSPFAIRNWINMDPRPYSTFGAKRNTLKAEYPLRQVFIVFLDSAEQYDMGDVFMTAYKLTLSEHLTIVDIVPPSRFSEGYYILQDHSGNLYEIHLLTNTMYGQYCLGNVDGVTIPTINPDPIIDKPTITVYKRDGSEMTDLEKGATALDFALLLWPEIGLYAKGVYINRRERKLETPLSNGDHVEIISDYHRGSHIAEEGSPEYVPPYAKIDWFLKVTTYTAKKALVKHFERQLNPPESK